MSLLLAQSGHHDRVEPCPLLGVKRTSRFHVVMSAFDPKRTSHVAKNCFLTWIKFKVIAHTHYRQSSADLGPRRIK